MILLFQVLGALLLAVMAGLIAVFLLESETEEPYGEMSEDWVRDQMRGER